MDDIIDEVLVLSAKQTSEQFSEQLERVGKDYGDYPNNIKITVEKAIDKIVKEQVKSFIICGEPQGGKTEMMICLSAKILDEGYKTIIILLNDDVNLLQQNLKRFQVAKINPAPITCNTKKLDNDIDLGVQIKNTPHIIFCKKNTSDMQVLEEILPKSTTLVIIDDEADYASPDSNVNKKDTDPTRINKYIDELLKRNADNIYVGVTATPARLDLNDTFKNDPRNWIYFEPNKKYCGRNIFFPADDSKINFSLHVPPDAQDEDTSLKKALLRFIVNVANLNTIREEDKNYYMLVHTSGKVDKHYEDEKRIAKIFHKILSPEKETQKKILEKLKKIIEDEYSNDEKTVRRILRYIVKNISRKDITIANHKREKTIAENMSSPTTPFSILIGGNVISRGATFDNLLAMFFYRDVKHKIQSDTFIQRARMFGVRNNYLSDFELTIPEDLYKKWRTCFMYYGLAIEQIKSGELPIWYKDNKINAAANASIKKFDEEGNSFIDMDTGEVRFDKFKFTPEIEEMIANSGSDGLATLNKLTKMLPSEEKFAAPTSLSNFISEILKRNSQNHQNVHFHQQSQSVMKQENTKHEEIVRENNNPFFGGPELKKWKLQGKHHVLRIWYNDKRMARLVYKFNDEGKVGSIKRKINNQENEE